MAKLVTLAHDRGGAAGGCSGPDAGPGGDFLEDGCGREAVFMAISFRAD